MSQIQIFIRLQVWNLNGKFKKEKKKEKSELGLILRSRFMLN